MIWTVQLCLVLQPWGTDVPEAVSQEPKSTSLTLGSHWHKSNIHATENFPLEDGEVCASGAQMGDMCLVHSLLPLLASQRTSAWRSEPQSLGGVVILSRQWIVASRELGHPICQDSLMIAGRDGAGFISPPANSWLRILLLLLPYSKNCNLADLYTPTLTQHLLSINFLCIPSVLISVNSVHSVLNGSPKSQRCSSVIPQT